MMRVGPTPQAVITNAILTGSKKLSRQRDNKATPGKNWYVLDAKKQIVPENVNVVPSPRTTLPVDRVVRFADARQYLFHALIGHGYEHVAGEAEVERACNGPHSCELIAVDHSEDEYDVLLNVRAPVDSRYTLDDMLPEIGEPVTISVVFDAKLGVETLKGKVVPVAAKYAGVNVAVRATRPQSAGGRVLGSHTETADFWFGHIGTQISMLEQRILELMSGRLPGVGSAFMKEFLLARNNYAIAGNDNVAGLPSNWRTTVDAVCTQHNLNPEQRAVVVHFFSHRITICVGPPGTGKSTLVDVILILLEMFGQDYHVCADSNAAVDVLGEKVCSRLGQSHPEGYLRVLSAYRENFTAERGSNTLRLEGPPGGQVNATDPGSDKVFMSVEKTIQRRMALRREGRLGRPLWRTEDEDLEALEGAENEMTRPRLEGEIEEEDGAAHEKRARVEFEGALRNLQCRYACTAKGVFSTAAATSGPFLRRHFKKSALLMDEGSQMSEAKAVLPIAHALSGGNLQRVLIIGDNNQLPPTRLAQHNPVGPSCETSLMERLILAGSSYIQLRTQYRMHPSISRVINAAVYGGTLLDGANTLSRPAVQKFKALMAKLKGASTANDFDADTCSVVVSPSKHKDFPVLGSQQMVGSSSCFNLQTAAMVFRTVAWLVDPNRGGFSQSDILVTAFYKDQVSLIKALLAKVYPGVLVCTVDGSQGKENMLQLVDCVKMGGGAQPSESVGFLGGDRRRPNVGLSRGMAGRILFCHEDFGKGKSFLTGSFWSIFLEEAKSKKSWLPDSLYHGPWPELWMSQHFDEVTTSFLRRAGKSGATGQLGHQNVVGSSQAMVMLKGKAQISAKQFNVEAFARATKETSVGQAEHYLLRTKQDLAKAINLWFEENDDGEEDIEELVM
ncbi:hypothetical protein LTR17_010912 [Elasticomyces elasticus]|nr:hypothetical protein LTR17_010912 [Elasticomyces elasticus]